MADSLLKKRPTKVRNVTIGPNGVKGTESQFALVASINMKTDVRQILFRVMAQEIETQAKLNNELSRFLVDGADNKPPDLVKKNLLALFGTEVSTQLFRLIETELMANIKAANYEVPGLPSNWQSSIGSMSSWEWTYLPPRKGVKSGERGKAIPTDPYSASSFPPGAIWILKPRDGVQAGMANRTKLWGTVVTKGKGDDAVKYSRYPRPTTKRGFIGQTTKSVKRRKIAAAYTIWGGYTIKYAIRGEQWVPDWMTDVQAKIGARRLTPYIMVMAKGKRSSGKGYRSDAAIAQKTAIAELKAAANRADRNSRRT